MTKCQVQTEYMLFKAAQLGAEAAMVDNELMAGTWRQCNVDHKAAIMRDMDALPHDAIGDEVRRQFAEAYDATIDFSIVPGGRHRP
jgi:hypothetical protein